MILSHTHKFIFIRTRKVAGTSVEIFLSQFCDGQDIVTPVGDAETGYTPANYRVAGYRRNRLLRIAGSLIGRPAIGHGGFYNHIPAREIRRLVGEDVWNACYKFSIERNPWDRQVSLYHWHYRKHENKPSFDTFIRSPMHRKISPNFDTYAIDGKVAANYICRYENLEEDLNTVLRQLRLEAKVALPQAKGSFRSRRAWREFYTPKTRDIVARWYAREIETFGYEF